MRIRDFFSTLNYAISILNDKNSDDIRSFEDNFDSIMEKSINYMRKVVEEKRKSSEEDLDINDVILDDYESILNNTYKNADISLISMKYIAVRYLSKHLDLIPELEREIQERGLKYSEEESYTDDFHENLITAVLGMQKDYEDNYSELDDWAPQFRQIVEPSIMNGEGKEDAFKKLYDEYGSKSMLNFSIRRQLMHCMYYTIFGIQGYNPQNTDKKLSIEKIKKTFFIKEYAQNYLERLEPIYREELEDAIISIFNQLDDFGEISIAVEKHNERMKRFALPGLGYQSDENSIYKGLPKAQTLMRKENLAKLSLDALLRMNSFYNNRFAKKISEYSMALFVIGNLDIAEECVNGRPISKDSLGQSKLNALLIKYQTLILPIKNFFSERQKEIFENPLEYLDETSAVEMDSDEKRAKKQVAVDGDELIRKTSSVWGNDYKKYFDERLPDVHNDIGEDITFTNFLYNPVFLTYNHKHLAMKSEYGYLHYLSKEDPKASLNFGISLVRDPDKAHNSSSILLASDGEVNLPNRLHTFKRDFTDFLIAYTGKPLVRIYEGFYDFYMGGEYMSSQLLLPNAKEHEKYLKALKRGKLGEKGDKASRITPINQRFIEHIEYCMDRSKFMPSLKVPETKIDNKGRVTTIQVQPVRYMDLTTGKRYYQKSDGSLVDKEGTAYGETTNEVRGRDE